MALSHSRAARARLRFFAGARRCKTKVTRSRHDQLAQALPGATSQVEPISQQRDDVQDLVASSDSGRRIVLGDIGHKSRRVLCALCDARRSSFAGLARISATTCACAISSLSSFARSASISAHCSPVRAQVSPSPVNHALPLRRELPNAFEHQIELGHVREIDSPGCARASAAPDRAIVKVFPISPQQC